MSSILGDPGVGKTNVLLRYSKRQFDYSYRPTHKVTISKLYLSCRFHYNMIFYDIFKFLNGGYATATGKSNSFVT